MVTRILLLILAVSLPVIAHPLPQKDRSIVSEDFTNARPISQKGTRRSGKPWRTYRLASAPLRKSLDKSNPDTLKVGVTIWLIERKGDRTGREVAKRVEADTQFREGDLIRLSIESQRTGYLYVIDRDWFTNNESGETNLIFPHHGEDNQLIAGKLIDIPSQDRSPFTASPALNQAGEMLTIIVTTSPLSLPLSNHPMPVSNTQLAEWERMWSGSLARFEMNDGAGKIRTIVEQQAASRSGSRQLTRDDPAPQTIYFVTPGSRNGLLFNVLLSYIR